MPISKLRQFREISLSPEALAYRRKEWVYCSAITLDNLSEHYTNWRTNRYAGESHPHECCRRIAVVTIDNKPYCRLHAGRIALDKWIKGDLQEIPKDTTAKSKPKPERKSTT